MAAGCERATGRIAPEGGWYSSGRRAPRAGNRTVSGTTVDHAGAIAAALKLSRVPVQVTSIDRRKLQQADPTHNPNGEGADSVHTPG
jgi:hypothetical protein